MPVNTTSTFGVDDAEGARLLKECNETLTVNATLLPGELSFTVLYNKINFLWRFKSHVYHRMPEYKKCFLMRYNTHKSLTNKIIHAWMHKSSSRVFNEAWHPGKLCFVLVEVNLMSQMLFQGCFSYKSSWKWWEKKMQYFFQRQYNFNAFFTILIVIFFFTYLYDIKFTWQFFTRST